MQSQDSFDNTNTNSNANFTNWVTLAALLVQRTALKLHPRKYCFTDPYCRVQTPHKGCKSKLNLTELVTFYFRDSYHNITKGSTAFCLQTATSNSEMTDEGDPNLNYNCCLIWPRFLSNNCHKTGRGQIAGGKWWITVKRIFDRDQPYIGHSCCELGGDTNCWTTNHNRCSGNVYIYIYIYIYIWMQHCKQEGQSDRRIVCARFHGFWSN